MMRDVQKACGILALLGALVSSPVVAADLVPEAPDLVPQLDSIEAVRGWYVRGDLGYNADTRMDGSSYSTFAAGAFTPQASTSNLSNRMTFGAGIGYSFTDMLRADVTLGRISSAFEGTGPCGSDCIRTASGEFAGYSALANAYVDFGTVIGLTPYVGAGLGYTYLGWDNVQSSSCSGGACVTASHPGESDWRFTYALMAGVAYDLTSNLKMDFGYRYTHMDGGGMYGWDAASAAAGATGLQASDDGFSTHEIRVGLRFAIW
jgi:opacity protein-like surface antigen